MGLDLDEASTKMLFFILQVNRPHPGDHPLLIIFMVGGVSVSEVKMVKDLVATRKPGTQVKPALSIHFLAKQNQENTSNSVPCNTGTKPKESHSQMGRNDVRFCCETSVGNKYSGTKSLFFHIVVTNKSSNSGCRVQNRLALIWSSFLHVSKD